VWRTTSLPGVEFLERFLWHVLPKGLRRTRRFGWWGNAVRTEKLTLLRRLLGVRPAEPAEPADAAPPASPADMPEETVPPWLFAGPSMLTNLQPAQFGGQTTGFALTGREPVASA